MLLTKYEMAVLSRRQRQMCGGSHLSGEIAERCAEPVGITQGVNYKWPHLKINIHTMELLTMRKNNYSVRVQELRCPGNQAVRLTVTE